jgi:transposase-like protein
MAAAKRCEVPILVRRVKYLNNIVEQDHRAIKRVTSQRSTSNHSARPRPCSPASS